MEGLEPLRELVGRRCGFQFDELREASLRKAVRERMAALSCPSTSEYYGHLIGELGEFTSLVSLLTVNETHFMREPATLRLFARRLAPDALARKPADARLRVLSAGCSSGEEAYSLLIALSMHLGPAVLDRVELLGADIDPAALDRARAGRFPEYSFRGVEAGIRELYFTADPDGSYRLRPPLAGRVRFLEFNLLAQSYPQELSGLDFIFYRNVSIYFEPGPRGDVFGKLSGLLNEGGCLLLASSEIHAHDLKVLDLAHEEDVFFFRKAAVVRGDEPPARRGLRPALRPTPEPLPAAGRGGRVPPGLDRPSSAAAPDAALAKALGLAREERHGEALRALESIPQGQRGADAELLRAGVLVELQRAEEATAVCAALMRRDEWNVGARLLLGRIADLCGDADTAIRELRRALYLKPSCWLADFYLGEAHRRRGDSGAARREYAAASRLLAQGRFAEHGLPLFPFTEAQMADSCRRHLENLRPGRGSGGADGA